MRFSLFLITISLWLPTVLYAQPWQPAVTGSFETITGLSYGALLTIQYPGGYSSEHGQG